MKEQANTLEGLHPNHLPDLRYVLNVLLGAQMPPHQRGDRAAAINGMRYIIKRTEEAAALAAQQEPPAPLAVGEAVAWLRSDGLKAMPADEKEAWLTIGQPELVENYTTPLYTHPAPSAPPGARMLTEARIEELAARIGSLSLHATRVHKLGGITRTILDPAGVIEFARAIEAEVNRIPLAAPEAGKGAK